MFEGWITRKEEEEIPVFHGHDEAKAYFKEKYGDAFVQESVDTIDGQNCYFCALIVDRETYYIGLRKMQLGQAVYGMDFLKSKQPIQIFEDGSIHIVH